MVRKHSTKSSNRTRVEKVWETLVSKVWVSSLRSGEIVLGNSFFGFTKVCKQNNVYIKHNVLYESDLLTSFSLFSYFFSKFPFF